VKSARLVELLDDYFGTREVRGDDWSDLFELVYPDPYWREFAEPGYEGRWNGLLVRGGEDVTRVATCVFPSDRVVGLLAPGTFLFSEHPIDYGDEAGFLPLAQETFERMRAGGIGFYHVHAPIDHHPEVSPSRLCAAAMGVPVEEEYLPIAEGIPGGAAVIGTSDASLDDLAARLQAALGAEVPVQVRHADRRQEEPHRLPASVADRLVVLRPRVHLGQELGRLVGGDAGVMCGHVRYRVEVFRVQALHPVDGGSAHNIRVIHQLSQLQPEGKVSSRGR